MKLQEQFLNLGLKAFELLQNAEKMRISLTGEKTDYIRYNHGKIRHNHFVDQTDVTCNFQYQKKEFSLTFTLGANPQDNLNMICEFLIDSRTQMESCVNFNSYVEIMGREKSSMEIKGEIPPISYFLTEFPKQLVKDDFVGILTAGSQFKAAMNSEGEFHWFETESFFLDYSIYDGPRAAKNTYSGRFFNEYECLQNLAETRAKLEKLKQTRKKILPKNYRTYLEPAAMAAILSKLVGWPEAGSPLGYSRYKQGLSPLKDLIEGRKSFSRKLNLNENFNLGFSPLFNSIGEVSPNVLPLISEGRLKNMLISTKSSQEYSVKSNQASVHEILRSPEIQPGQLAKSDVLAKLQEGLYLSNLHYLNWSDAKLARITGMTRFACYWVENGQIIAPIEDARFDVSLYDIFGSELVDLDEKSISMMDTSTYSARSLGGMQTPGSLIENFTFTL